MTDPLDQAGPDLLNHLADIISQSNLEMTQAEIGPFKVLEQVGSGGMGVVYRALHTGLDRVVALKISRIDDPDIGSDARFVTEAKAAARIDHENVVRVFELGETGGRQYIAMEFVEGRSLSAWLKERSVLERKHILECAAIGIGIARGVQAAHEQGVIHRDLKPQNVMITPDNRIKVADFGLACLQQSRVTKTKTGLVMGTLAYMPPEQVRGDRDKVGPASDVYGIGTILYYLLSGGPLFKVEAEAELVNAVLNRDVERVGRKNRHVDRDLETIVMKCLEKDPARRYATAAGLADDLNRYLKGEAIQARPAGVGYRLWKGASRRKAVLIPTAVFLAAGVILAGWAFTLRSNAEQNEEALRLLEKARPALEQAQRSFYQKDVQYDSILAKTRKAHALIEQAIALAPTLPSAHYLRGRSWAVQGWHDRAEASWRKVIELDPAFGPAHYHLGRLLLTNALIVVIGIHPGEYEDREAECRSLLADGTLAIDAALASNTAFDNDLERDLARAMSAGAKDDPSSSLQIARSGLEKFRSHEGAEDLYWVASLNLRGNDRLEALDKALARCPRHVPSLYSRGLHYNQDHRYQEALDDLSLIIEISPRFWRALFARGQVRRELRDLDGALADYSEALRLSPGRAMTHYNRGGVRKEKGDVDGAMEDYSTSIRLFSGYSSAYVNRGVLWRQKGDLEKALIDFNHALHIDPENTFALAGRARIRSITGDLDAGLADSERAIQLDPRCTDAFAVRATIKDKKGDVLGMVEDYTRAIALRPGSAEFHVFRADGYSKIPDFDKALADYSEAIRMEPKNAGAWAGRGGVLRFKGDSEGAVSDFTEAIRLDPGSPFHRMLRGETRMKLGDRKGALADFTEAVLLDPRNPDALSLRGDLLLASGDSKAAGDEYRKALDTAPPHWPFRAAVEQALHKIDAATDH